MIFPWHILSAIARRYRYLRIKVLVADGCNSERMAMKPVVRKASVSWKGGAKAFTNESPSLKPAGFTFGTSFNGSSNTASAELIAAAHANSFVLALFQELGPQALRAGNLFATAAVSLELLAAGWTIIGIHLHVVAKLPQVTQSEFIDATVRAKTNCLVSRLVRANISMNAKLEK
jgi:osmotically inducible protein OsmC